MLEMIPNGIEGLLHVVPPGGEGNSGAELETVRGQCGHRTHPLRQVDGIDQADAVMAGELGYFPVSGNVGGDHRHAKGVGFEERQPETFHQ